MIDSKHLPQTGLAYIGPQPLSFNSCMFHFTFFFLMYSIIFCTVSFFKCVTAFIMRTLVVFLEGVQTCILASRLERRKNYLSLLFLLLLHSVEMQDVAFSFFFHFMSFFSYGDMPLLCCEHLPHTLNFTNKSRHCYIIVWYYFSTSNK